MEDGFPKKRNVRPVEKSNLPIITLSVLVLLVLAILYVGYEYITDSPASTEELTSVVEDTTEVVGDEKENALATEDASLPPTEETAVVPAETAPAKKETKSISAASLGGQSYKHKVQSGETWTSIASRYNLNTETLQGLNSSVSDIKAGTTTLSLQVQAIHTVGPGDVLRVVAGKYNVSKEAIMKANGKTKDFAERGEKLVIPFANRK